MRRAERERERERERETGVGVGVGRGRVSDCGKLLKQPDVHVAYTGIWNHRQR